MKYTLFTAFFLIAVLGQAQIISSTDAAVLFSGNEHYGTARYESLGGAFGALGGDLSAGDINPAGLAVYLNNESAFTLSSRSTDINTNFYGNKVANNDQFLNFNQAGGVLIFNVADNSKWRRVALGFNYSIVNNFANSFVAQGNSGTPDFLDDPYLNYDNNTSNDVFYNQVNGQTFINNTSGLNDRFSFNIAANYDDKLYYGFSILSYNLDYSQIANLAESNQDASGNTLDASYIQTLQTTGSGMAFNFGILARLSNEFRVGLSYRSPIWYALTDNYSNDLLIDVSNNSNSYTDYKDGIYDYKLSTPSNLTASAAYLFGKLGLISFDYTYKDYQTTKLRPTAVYLNENQDMSNSLRGVSQYRIGTEWRFGLVNIRGGYFYEQNPYKASITSDNLTGYSAGLGFRVGMHSKLDLAYTNSKQTQPYGFLQASNPADLSIKNKRITATFVFGF